MGPELGFTAKIRGQRDLGHKFKGLKAAVHLAVGLFRCLINASSTQLCPALGHQVLLWL